MPTATFSARPRYSLLDVAGLLLKQLALMLAVFLVVFLIGAAFVMTLKKSYTAYASVFTGVGQEYVYQPRVGVTTDRGQAPPSDEVARTEATIMGSHEVKIRVVEALTPEGVLGPAGPGGSPPTTMAALKALDSSLKIGTAPGEAVITASYQSDDAERAARVLNTVIDEYLAYRREVVFADRNTEALRAQREVFEADLAEADAAYETFLHSNDIGDFVAARAALATTHQTVYADRLSVQALLNQTSRRLATLEAQLAVTPAEIVLQQDLNISAQDELLRLRTEREGLLARYTPDSQPVRDLEARINQLQAHVATGQAVGAKEVRTGPNPIWTELETTRVNTLAERDSLAARLLVLDRQLTTLRARQTELTALESSNATLAGEREVLSASIRDFQQREAQSRADSGLVRAGADNVTVIGRAAAPLAGKSLKAPLLAALFLFAAFTALCVGLLRIFLRRGFSTPASAGRTLEMPVLAVAPMKAQ